MSMRTRALFHATVVLNAKGQSMSLRPQFCRTASGPWQLQKKH